MHWAHSSLWGRISLRDFSVCVQAGLVGTWGAQVVCCWGATHQHALLGMWGAEVLRHHGFAYPYASSYTTLGSQEEFFGLLRAE